MAEPATLYEAMYILDARTPDEEAQRISEALQAALTSVGGEFVADELFGRRRLAYPIEGHVEGIYRVLYFRGNGAVASEVKHQFTLIQPIVRGMVVVANPQAIFSAAPAKPAEAPAEETGEAVPPEAAGEVAEAAEVPPTEVALAEAAGAEATAEPAAEPKTVAPAPGEEQSPAGTG